MIKQIMNDDERTRAERKAQGLPYSDLDKKIFHQRENEAYNRSLPENQKIRSRRADQGRDTSIIDYVISDQERRL